MENFELEAKERANTKQYVDDLRMEALRVAKEQGIGIAHVRSEYLPGQFHPGGLTVAFSKCSEHKHGIMVYVAVSVCSPKDTFSRKLGTFSALQKFFNGQTIALPLLIGVKGDTRDLNWIVKEAFTGLLDVSNGL